MNRNYLEKLKWSLPWLVRFPFVRGKALLGRETGGEKHLIFTIANHFEPSWSPDGLLGRDEQLRRLEAYHKLARRTGDSVKDADGTKFRHTNFYPGEQYDKDLIDILAAMQSEGLGEVEVHLHHGVDAPDTAENLRNSLTEFRDTLAEDHKLLSHFEGDSQPKYAFVHGNLALANSCSGKYCGVDNEMQVLQETGCYVDMTLPSAPDESQVAMLNDIYECTLPLDQKVPHRKGRSVEVHGNDPQLPIIFTGPLTMNWSRRVKGIPIPRLDDGALVASQPMDLARLRRWTSANVTVKGNPDWIFVKLYCHGFFDQDQSAAIGEDAARFFSDIIENGEKTGEYKVHFATAREAVNMVWAAKDGERGNPSRFRDYKLIAQTYARQKMYMVLALFSNVFGENLIYV